MVLSEQFCHHVCRLRLFRRRCKGRWQLRCRIERCGLRTHRQGKQDPQQFVLH